MWRLKKDRFAEGSVLGDPSIFFDFNNQVEELERSKGAVVCRNNIILKIV